jgi:hypothetical protein
MEMRRLCLEAHCAAGPLLTASLYRAIHSSSFDQRRRPASFFMAIAIALRCPNRMTNFFPRVRPV